MPDPLPIHAIADDLVGRLRSSNRLILSAPTGSGKSTQVPALLLQHGLLGQGQVVVLQPRRLATRLLAKRVAEELGVPLGGTVGYQIRLENVTSRETRIRFVTEGILLRQMIDRPHLDGVTAILFDEFHERHLHGDITLAQALHLQETHRPDLRLVVMSATLDLQRLSQYLAPCDILTAQGRTFPVDIQYASDLPIALDRPVWELAVEAYSHHCRRADPGDTLVFMPGAYEIQRTLEAFRQCSEARGHVLLPLHGDLPPRDQDNAVAPHSRPKIVVATNVAETSLTIDGIRLVIDSGLARLPRHDPWRGINTLWIEPISRAAADQRAGRAGRTTSGTCIRLWSANNHQHRPAHELPEVQRLDLAEVVLHLKAAGVTDLRQFRWLEPPGEAALHHAESLLTDLGALEPSSAAHSQITPLGQRLLAFPVHPRYARLLLAAADLGCVHHAALLAALTQTRDLLIRRVDRDTERNRDDRLGDRAPSDFFHLMRAWQYAADQSYRLEACQKVGIHANNARQVGATFRAFLDLAQREGLDVSPRELDEAALRRCILLAFSDHLARRTDTGTLRCDMVHGRRGTLARESVVHHAPLLVAADVREISGRDGELTTLLSLATAIEPDWIEADFPHDLTRTCQVSYDPTSRRVLAEDQLQFRGLTLLARSRPQPPEEEAARLLAREVLAGRLPLPAWDHAVDQWILRLNHLVRACPELGLPPLLDTDREDLITQVCLGAFSFKDLKERQVRPVIQDWLSPQQQSLLDRHAPERLELPNHRKPKVTYVADGPPFIALRIQELFGIQDTPTVALGRSQVTVHILAPSMRPVQVTQDLARFWTEHYPRVKSELQRKYPKHEWR